MILFLITIILPFILSLKSFAEYTNDLSMNASFYAEIIYQENKKILSLLDEVQS